MQNKFLTQYGPWGVITGASDGIGKALAYQLAQQGLNLILIARREELLQGISADIIKQYKIEVKILSIDLVKSNSLEIIKIFCKEYKIGLFAAIAGFGTSGEFIKNDIKNEINMLEVNCKAVLEQVHFFANIFLMQKRGGIFLMGSLVGFQGVPYSANYAASKAYIQSLAEGLYFELKGYGVDVLCCAPGPVHSGFATRAKMKLANTADPNIIAKGMVKNLGKSITIRPGFLAKFLGWSLITLPRFFRILVMKNIMHNFTMHQKN